MPDISSQYQSRVADADLSNVQLGQESLYCLPGVNYNSSTAMSIHAETAGVESAWPFAESSLPIPPHELLPYEPPRELLPYKPPPHEPPPHELPPYELPRVVTVPSHKAPMNVKYKERTKITKRNGPLEWENRRKTYEIRIAKDVCLRCRFYKIAVSLLLFNMLQCTDLRESATNRLLARIAKK